MFVISSHLRSRVHLLPGRSVRLLPQLVSNLLFKGVAICFNQYRSAVTFVVRVNVGRVLLSRLRLRFLFTRKSRGVLRRSPIGRDAVLICPHRLRTNGLPSLRWQYRDDNCRAFFIVGVCGGIRFISRLAILKSVAQQGRGFAFFTAIRVRTRNCLLRRFRHVMLSWLGTRDFLLVFVFPAGVDGLNAVRRFKGGGWLFTLGSGFFL